MASIHRWPGSFLPAKPLPHELVPRREGVVQKQMVPESPLQKVGLAQ